jgi:hypothetical protein
MIRVQPLRDLISMSIASAYLKNERSVSLLVIAKPESGKTTMLTSFAVNNGVAYLSDITYTGIVNLLGDIQDGKIKTILIPDMLKALGRKEATVENLITLLNALIEEGIKTISTYNYYKEFEKFVRCNIIAAITSTDWFLKKATLGSTGFLSRVVPFSYNYSYEDVEAIFKEIIEGRGNNIEFEKLRIGRVGKTGKEIVLPFEFGERIKENIVKKVVERVNRALGLDVYGFRLQRNLQALAKASALLRGDDTVREEDVKKLEYISEWINFDFNIIRDGEGGGNEKMQDVQVNIEGKKK